MLLIWMNVADATPPEDVPCEAQVQAWLPVDGAVDVPLDVRPAFAVQCDPGDGAVTLRERDTGRVLTGVSSEWTSQTSGAVVRVETAEDLLPSTAYELSYAGWDAIPHGIGFTTGETTLGTEPPSAPELDLSFAHSRWDGPMIEVGLTLFVGNAATDAVLFVETGEGDFVSFPPESGYALGAGDRVLPGVDACVSAYVEDRVGRASETARACVPVEVPPDPAGVGEEPERGCSTVPAVPWLGLLVLPFLRRRRS